MIALVRRYTSPLEGFTWEIWADGSDRWCRVEDAEGVLRALYQWTATEAVQKEVPKKSSPRGVFGC